jgi:hypothetical protein
MLAMFLGTAILTKANNTNNIGLTNEVTGLEYYSTKAKDYNFVANYEQLGRYLNLDVKDTFTVNRVNYIYDAFCDGMNRAKLANNEISRERLVLNSIDYVIKNMHIYLNKEQYRKFLIKLNTSLYERGFLMESLRYCSEYCS